MAPKAIEEALCRLTRRAKVPPLSTAPDTPFDALLEQQLKALERQVEELKGRVNGLMFAVVAAVIVQLVLGLVR